MRTHPLIGIAAIATLAVAGCVNESTGSAGPSTPAPATTASTPAVGDEINLGGLTTAYHGTADVTAAHNLTIQLADHYFEPTVIHGNPGQELVLALQNKTENPHTFTTADGLADIELKPRSVAEGKITLPQSGNLLFYSRLDKDHAMIGLINVSGPLNSPVPTVSAHTT